MARAESSVPERVVHTVAERTGSDPLELPPLYEYVDTDALEAFVQGTTDGLVEFHYVGHTVTVDSRGEVEIDELVAVGSSTEGAVSGD